jgi:hypothetical protein
MIQKRPTGILLIVCICSLLSFSLFLMYQLATSSNCPSITSSSSDKEFLVSQLENEHSIVQSNLLTEQDERVFHRPPLWSRFRLLRGYKFLKKSIVHESLRDYLKMQQSKSIEILERIQNSGGNAFDHGLKLTVFRLNPNTQSGIGNQWRKLHSAFTYALAYDHWFLIDFDFFHLLFDSPVEDVNLNFKYFNEKYQLNSMINDRRSKGDVVSDFHRDDPSFVGTKRYETFERAVCVEYTESGSAYYDMLYDSKIPNDRLFGRFISSISDPKDRNHALDNVSRSLWISVYYGLSFLMQRPTLKYLNYVGRTLNSNGIPVSIDTESRKIVRKDPESIIVALQYRFFMDVFRQYLVRETALRNYLDETKLVLERLVIDGLPEAQKKKVTIFYCTDNPETYDQVTSELAPYSDKVVTVKEQSMIHSKDFLFGDEIPPPMLDWFIMSESDLMITTGTSFALSAAQRKDMMPFYSLKTHGWWPKGPFKVGTQNDFMGDFQFW